MLILYISIMQQLAYNSMQGKSFNCYIAMVEYDSPVSTKDVYQSAAFWCLYILVILWYIVDIYIFYDPNFQLSCHLAPSYMSPW